MSAKYNRITGEGSVIITDHKLQARPRKIKTKQLGRVKVLVAGECS